MVTSGAITQRFDRLQARDLVTRTSSESDGRCVHVALTEDGRALIDQALPDTENRVRRLLHGPPARSPSQTQSVRGLSY